MQRTTRLTVDVAAVEKREGEASKPKL